MSKKDKSKPKAAKAKRTVEELAALRREAANARWSSYRRDRIAQGLAPTIDAARGRDRFIADADDEATWMYEAVRLGLVGDDARRLDHRKTAKLLCDAALAIALSGRQPRNGRDGDLELLVEFWAREGVRWRAAAERARIQVGTFSERASAADRALAAARDEAATRERRQ